jgi:hypothetical protein
MTPEGILVLTKPGGEVVFSTLWFNPDPPIPGSNLKLLPNGTFVVGKVPTTHYVSGQVPNDPCGTWRKYDPVNDRSAPEREGFLGGIGYNDKTYQYVGYGNNTKGGQPCIGQGKIY